MKKRNKLVIDLVGGELSDLQYLPLTFAVGLVIWVGLNMLVGLVNLI